GCCRALGGRRRRTLAEDVRQRQPDHGEHETYPEPAQPWVVATTLGVKAPADVQARLASAHSGSTYRGYAWRKRPRSRPNQHRVRRWRECKGRAGEGLAPRPPGRVPA